MLISHNKLLTPVLGDLIKMVICKLKISKYCEKTIKKKEVKYIDGKECCGVCFWLKKEENKK